jgi:hypothetical protein
LCRNIDEASQTNTNSDVEIAEYVIQLKIEVSKFITVFFRNALTYSGRSIKPLLEKEASFQSIRSSVFTGKTHILTMVVVNVVVVIVVVVVVVFVVVSCTVFVKYAH